MSHQSQISVEEAIGTLSAAAPAPAQERAPLAGALGRVLAADLPSLVAHPSASDSALDGYACRAEDTLGASRERPVRLRVVGEVAAGRAFAGTVGPGEAVQLYTGAPVPEGADAVIRVEDTERQGEAVLLCAPASRADVRPRAQDFDAGEVLLERGQRLDAASLALAAAMGHAEVPVSRRPRVGVLATGDEVLSPGQALRPGQVYDANSAALAALVAAAGAEPVPLERVRDDVDALERALAASGPLELLLTSGGVSMGKHDVVRDLLFERGEVLFWKVAMRPAGPVLFGRWRGLPVLGLPGNPVSSVVAFLVLAKAFLNRALGSAEPLPYRRRLAAVAGEALAGAGFKEAFLRVRLAEREGVRQATLTGSQNSGVLRSLQLADALAVIPPHRAYGPGEALEVIPLEPYLR